MASTLITLQTTSTSTSFALFTNRSSNSLLSPIHSHLPTFSSAKKPRLLKLNPIITASAEGLGVPAELIEDSKFVPLDAGDLRYGPPALLLLGFDMEETTKIQKFLTDLDGEFMKIILCTENMITCSLWDAMNTEQQNWEHLKISKSLPRICFLSGLTGEEMVMFIDAFPETGLEPAVFAAFVPNSADKLLQEVIEEVMEDHEMVNAIDSGST